MGDNPEKCDRNFYRNYDSRSDPAKDTHPSIRCILDNPWLITKSILEIGAGNGHALARIHNITKAKCYGIEPSIAACKHGNENFNGIQLYEGSAEKYPLELQRKKYDLIIFGGVLFHLPPKNFFKVIGNALDVINENGYIMIFDFHNQGAPIYRKYKHEDNQYVYKYDHEKILSMHPSFRLTYSKILLSNEPYSKSTEFDTFHYAALWKFSNLEKFIFAEKYPTKNT